MEYKSVSRFIDYFLEKRGGKRIMKRYYLYFSVVLVIFVFGCGYTPAPSVLPENIRKISVRQFVDKTGHLLISRKLTDEVVKEFLQDRRVGVVNLDLADAVLLGEISKYILQPLSFDENYIAQEYKLWVWVNIGLKDAATNKMLWVEKRMTAETEYFVVARGGGSSLTESEAQNIVVKSLAKDIVKRTIDGWFAASGISEKR